MVVAVSAVVVVVVVAATARPSVDRLSNCFLLSPSPAPATWTTAGGERRNARQRLGHSPPSFVRRPAAVLRHAGPGRPRVSPRFSQIYCKQFYFRSFRCPPGVKYDEPMFYTPSYCTLLGAPAGTDGGCTTFLPRSWTKLKTANT